MKWEIWHSKITTNYGLLLYDDNYTALFDKCNILDISINNKENDVSVKFVKSVYICDAKDITEFEAILYLEKYKEQIVQECKKLSHEFEMSETSKNARDKLVNYLLDFVSDIKDGDENIKCN